MPRNRTLDRALGTSKRSIWIATGFILLIGMVLLFWLFSPTELNRRERVDRLAPGDHMGRVAQVLGPPGARCAAGDLSRFAGSFPPGWPSAAVETTLQALEQETADRWVYPLDEDEAVSCTPTEGWTEIGLDAEGSVLWLVAITGESPLRLPDRFTPAATD